MTTPQADTMLVNEHRRRRNARGVIAVLAASLALAGAGAAAADDRAAPPSPDLFHCVFDRGVTTCHAYLFEYVRTFCGPTGWWIDEYSVSPVRWDFRGNRTAGEIASYDSDGRPIYDDYKRRGGRLLSAEPGHQYFAYAFGERCADEG